MQNDYGETALHLAKQENFTSGVRLIETKLEDGQAVWK